jgi:hypothetical protein
MIECLWEVVFFGVLVYITYIMKRDLWDRIKV